MDNSLKAIILGAGVVITMIVVSIGFLLMRQGQSTAQASIGKLGQFEVEMMESDYTMYDGMEVRGNEVINVLRKFKNEYIGIHVITKRADTWYNHVVNENGEIDSKSSSAISDAMNETKETYINPNGAFIGAVIRDENDRISALEFVQQ